MCYIVLFSLGISEENLAKLCEHAQIPSDYRLVDIFISLFYCLSRVLQNRPLSLAAMLSLGGIKSFVFVRQASARREISARLTLQKQSFLFS